MYFHIIKDQALVLIEIIIKSAYLLAAYGRFHFLSLVQTGDSLIFFQCNTEYVCKLEIAKKNMANSILFFWLATISALPFTKTSKRYEFKIGNE